MTPFKDTYQAIEFGRTASKQAIEKLQNNRMKKLEIAHLFRLENEINWAMQVLFSAQLDREATEAYNVVNQ